MKIFSAVCLGFICLVGFALVITGGNWFAYEQQAIFAPKYESVRRDTMIQSRAYSEATLREFYRLKLQYQQAKTQDEKDTITAMARHESQSFDTDRLPADLQLFVKELN